MLTHKQLIEVLETLKGYNTPEVREIKQTVARLLSGVTGVDVDVEFESLKVQLHNLIN